MDIFTILWLLWGLYFVIVEGIALFYSKPGDKGATLSAHVWAWFGTKKENSGKRNGWSRLRRYALISFMVWLTVHFITGGWM